MGGAIRISVNDLPKRYRKQVRDKLAKEGGHRAAFSASNLEQNSTNEFAPQNEAKVFDQAVSIHIHSIRKRLTDADGLSAKWVIDQLAVNGIIHDDNPAFVKEVTFSQEKGKPEKTIITIKEV